MSVIVSAASLNNKISGDQLSMDTSSNLDPQSNLETSNTLTMEVEALDALSHSLPPQLPHGGLNTEEFDLWKQELLLFLASNKVRLVIGNIY